jgi:hypothetical protein
MKGELWQNYPGVSNLPIYYEQSSQVYGLGPVACSNPKLILERITYSLISISNATQIVHSLWFILKCDFNDILK